MYLIEFLIVWYITKYADVAQLAEQLICNQQVIGSSPIIGLETTVKTVVFLLFDAEHTRL